MIGGKFGWQGSAMYQVQYKGMQTAKWRKYTYWNIQPMKT